MEPTEAEPGKPLLVRGFEAVLFAGRWLLAPLYLAMLVLLGMLVTRFLLELVHALPMLARLTETQLIMLTLSLIDLSLAANLVVLVILSGYENFVSRILLSPTDPRPQWMGSIDYSGLKLKLMSSITAIAAVHVLRVFFEVRAEPDRVVYWQGGLMLAFVVTGLLLALTDRVAGHG